MLLTLLQCYFERTFLVDTWYIRIGKLINIILLPNKNVNGFHTVQNVNDFHTVQNVNDFHTEQNVNDFHTVQCHKNCIHVLTA